VATVSVIASAVSDWSVELSLLNAPTHTGAQWQLDLSSGNFSVPKYASVGWDTVRLNTIWLTSLPENTTFKARVKIRYPDLTESPWYVTDIFKTRRVATLGTSLFTTENEGSKPTLLGQYGNGSGVGFVTPSFPELVVKLKDYAGLKKDVGWRSRMFKTLGNYDQSSLPIALSHAVRYTDAAIVGPTKSVTMIFVFLPEMPDLGFPYGSTIAGGESAAWWLYQYDGSLGGMRGRDGLLSNPLEYAGGGALRMEKPNLLIIKYRQTAWHVDTGCPGMPAIDSPLIYSLWLNGVKVTSTDPAARDGFGAYGSCTLSGVPHTNFYLPTLSLTSPIYVGTCTSGAQPETAGGNHGYAGIMSEFAWAPEYLITDSLASALYGEFSTGNMESFADTVKTEINPLIYDRYSQPKYPEKPMISAVLS
jgi:hypothetical protein